MRLTCNAFPSGYTDVTAFFCCPLRAFGADVSCAPGWRHALSRPANLPGTQGALPFANQRKHHAQ